MEVKGTELIALSRSLLDGQQKELPKSPALPKEETICISKYLNRANRGESDSQLMVSYIYQYGRGVARDVEEAKEWLQRSAKSGNVVAQARQLFFGWNKETDYEQCHDMLINHFTRKRSRPQEMIGFAMLGVNFDFFCFFEFLFLTLFCFFCFEWMYLEGKGVAQNVSKTMEYYQKSAERGNDAAIFVSCFTHLFDVSFFSLAK